ncbi:lipid A core-O-antigen ligase-like enyme [Desulfosporosinus acidiphilus SJ4]|uniref:Lipid A core-O-antigen ligase-like enyme n=1 Tax=Desulfosporosinus acidiphilus (strain DSM 22704 / JCM 16185 / SJ4) TaxID=646529 RepID=I4D8L2_DESAJ|nr:O-antigen ligase family protein [Desulfosporosinus acidiphilus]AFM42136.1 lipid A core-O-antigen ligase-like enyme [Desulfosporosinus acidiphilus SJ4]
MGFTLLEWGILLLCFGMVCHCGRSKPNILPSLLAGAVALDISIDWFPPLGPLGSQSISLARLVTVGILGSALWRLWLEPQKRQKLKVILNCFLSRSLLIYIAVGAFSLFYTIDLGKTAVGVVRLLILFLLYLGTFLLAERNQVLLPFQVVHWVGVALVPLALYEGMTRHFIWREYLAQGEIARVNATFVDPNIFARYLVLAIVANLVLQYFNRETKKHVVYLVSLFSLLGALAITLSRSGELTLVIILVLMILLIPRKQMIQPIGLIGLIGSGIVAMSPLVRHRLLTFMDGMGALDQRKYLIKVAWTMFTDHPMFGVGLGVFEKMFKTHYINMKTVIPYVEGATLSHTTLLTIAAELGFMGLTALALVWFALIRILRSLRRLDQNGTERYLLGVGYFIWIVTIFISSQSEGRFFEDPVLWISMAMMLSLFNCEECGL